MGKEEIAEETWTWRGLESMLHKQDRIERTMIFVRTIVRYHKGEEKWMSSSDLKYCCKAFSKSDRLLAQKRGQQDQTEVYGTSKKNQSVAKRIFKRFAYLL